MINSRYPRFSATSDGSGRKDHHRPRHTFSRSYGVILPSSLARVVSSALGYSPRLPVSDYGTVTTAINSAGAFLGSMELPSLWSLLAPPHYFSGYMALRLSRRVLECPPTSLNPVPEGTSQYGDGLSFSVPPAEIIRSGTGLLTCFPSATLFSLALGTD